MKETKATVVCISAATAYYQSGNTYPIYEDEAKVKYTLASDGRYDVLGKTASKFASKEGNTNANKDLKR